MKALSFKDPWGFLVAAGLKDVENSPVVASVISENHSAGEAGLIWL